MSSEFEDKPFSESNLDSPEYRKRLMRKLNTLIAVLEVACSKVRRSLAGPDPDVERLNRIHKNLTDTLQVCLRAKKALENCEKLPEELPENLKALTQAEMIKAAEEVTKEGKKKPRSKPGEPVRSKAERDRFAQMKPIEAKEIRQVDIDALCKQLLG